MADDRARAYLEGGPADGQVVQLDEPEWSPLAVITVVIGQVEVVYVRVPGEPQAADGTWRYVSEETAETQPTATATSMIDDPFDD